ncbi:MAG: DUF2950 domain-containing protein [Candidatus Acidiferrales bacterium]
MHHSQQNLKNNPAVATSKLAILALVAAAIFPAISLAQAPGQKTYPTAEAASQALFQATEQGDQNALLEVLGPDGKEIVSSGDAAEDSANRANFAQQYKFMHRLVAEPDGTTTLYIGAENWPTPIPLVEKDNRWYFDTATGKEEILFRRIGKNELSAIRICQELVAAQHQFYSKENDQYAAKFVSDKGKHDGLYWPDATDQYASPIGPLLAGAGTSAAEPKSANNTPVPFRGYYFRILDSQGKDAAGGPINYVVDGKMTKGFAFVAYPARYRDSGVMTFIVNQEGVVYEKDLGKDTEKSAASVTSYDPGPTWQKTEDQEQEQEQSAQSQKPD